MNWFIEGWFSAPGWFTGGGEAGFWVIYNVIRRRRLQ